MSIQGRIYDAGTWVAEHLKGRQLLGEVELDVERRRELTILVRDLINDRRQPTDDVPEVVALLIVDIARRYSNGRRLWDYVCNCLVPARNLSAAEKDDWRILFGEAFLRTLERFGLPQFSHLVEAGAPKYVAPILAHALMPLKHLDTFMGKVIWPALQRPEEIGQDARDIQDWMATSPPAGVTRAVERFVTHGGSVARDIIDRTLAYCASAVHGESDSGLGLPDWLSEGIDDWVRQNGTVAAPQTRQRMARPTLRFDDRRCEVVVDLPYLDRPATWTVTISPGSELVSLDACPPRFARIRQKEQLVISRPAISIRAELSGSTVGRWDVPLLSEARPALFFHERDGRLLPPGDVLEGQTWWVLAPDQSVLETDGNPSVSEARCAPIGWQGYEAKLVRCDRASELRLALPGAAGGSPSELRYRVAAEPPRASFDMSKVEPWLEPLDTDILATEDRLPALRIPARDGSAPDRYLSYWEVRAEHAGEGSEVCVRPAREMQPTFQDGEWRLRLEDLIPGHDVGTWTVTASGPIGLGVRKRISILPAGMRWLEVPLAPEVRRPAESSELTPRPRVVVVQAPGDVRVCESGDRETPGTDGTWTLEDRDLDGRIPFTVRDARTGREAAAVVVLPAVEWRWRSDDPRDWQTVAVLSLDDVLSGKWTLQGRGSVPLRASLQLITEDGKVVQEKRHEHLRHQWEFRLAEFSTTVQASTARVLYLDLVVEDRNGRDAARVGAIERRITVTEVRTQFAGGQLQCSWRQSVDVDGMNALLEPLWRPWEEAADGEVKGGGGEYRAVWWIHARGPMRLTLRVADPWMGQTTVVDQVVEIGDAAERKSYLRGLRHVAGTRSRVQATFERFIARDAPAAELSTLTNDADAKTLETIIDTLAGIVERGVTDEVAQEPWWELGAALAVLPRSTSAAPQRIADPLLRAVARARPSGALRLFLSALGVPAWRALRHTALEDDTRRRLWGVWPPLGAFLDRVHIGEPAAAQRWRDNVGVLPFSSWEQAMAVGGLCVRGQFRPGGQGMARLSPVIPGPLLSDAGWRRAIAHDLAHLGNQPQLLGDEVSVAEVEPYSAMLTKALGKEFASSLRLPGGSAPWPECLPWMSLVLASWQRLYAHNIVQGQQNEVAKVLRLAARIARAVPGTYERDLCFAEALVE